MFTLSIFKLAKRAVANAHTTPASGILGNNNDNIFSYPFATQWQAHSVFPILTRLQRDNRLHICHTYYK